MSSLLGHSQSAPRFLEIQVIGNYFELSCLLQRQLQSLSNDLAVLVGRSSSLYPKECKFRGSNGATWPEIRTPPHGQPTPAGRASYLRIAAAHQAQLIKLLILLAWKEKATTIASVINARMWLVAQTQAYSTASLWFRELSRRVVTTQKLPSEVLAAFDATISCQASGLNSQSGEAYRLYSLKTRTAMTHVLCWLFRQDLATGVSIRHPALTFGRIVLNLDTSSSSCVVLDVADDGLHLRPSTFKFDRYSFSVANLSIFALGVNSRLIASRDGVRLLFYFNRLSKYFRAHKLKEWAVQSRSGFNENNCSTAPSTNVKYVRQYRYQPKHPPSTSLASEPLCASHQTEAISKADSYCKRRLDHSLSWANSVESDLCALCRPGGLSTGGVKNAKNAPTPQNIRSSFTAIVCALNARFQRAGIELWAASIDSYCNVNGPSLLVKISTNSAIKLVADERSGLYHMLPSCLLNRRTQDKMNSLRGSDKAKLEIIINLIHITFTKRVHGLAKALGWRQAGKHRMTGRDILLSAKARSFALQYTHPTWSSELGIFVECTEFMIFGAVTHRKQGPGNPDESYPEEVGHAATLLTVEYGLFGSERSVKIMLEKLGATAAWMTTIEADLERSYEELTVHPNNSPLRLRASFGKSTSYHELRTLNLSGSHGRSTKHTFRQHEWEAATCKQSAKIGPHEEWMLNSREWKVGNFTTRIASDLLTLLGDHYVVDQIPWHFRHLLLAEIYSFVIIGQNLTSQSQKVLSSLIVEESQRAAWRYSRNIPSAMMTCLQMAQSPKSISSRRSERLVYSPDYSIQYSLAQMGMNRRLLSRTQYGIFELDISQMRRRDQAKWLVASPGNDLLKNTCVENNFARNLRGCQDFLQLNDGIVMSPHGGSTILEMFNGGMDFTQRFSFEGKFNA